MIARKGSSGTSIDVKTGRPGPSHVVQVMLYMYAVPKAMGRHYGVDFDGRVAYGDHEVEIPASAVGRVHPEPFGPSASAERCGAGPAGAECPGVLVLRHIVG